MAVPIPWWAKIAAKLVLSRLPFGYGVWQRLGLFRHGAMDSAEYAQRVFEGHLRRTDRESRLKGATVLELGPGDSIATAIFAAAKGARAILVDHGPFARTDPALCRNLATAAGVSLDPLGSLDEVLERCGARYLTEGLRSLGAIESGSVDLVFSQAVLEHIRRREFLPTLRELRRVLKPGGVSSHVVDLKDHLGGALNNLRFTERRWESELFASSGFYTNRIRFQEMLDLFREAGFDVELAEVRRWPALPTPRAVLSAEFREVPDDDLRVTDFDVILRPA